MTRRRGAGSSRVGRSGDSGQSGACPARSVPRPRAPGQRADTPPAGARGRGAEAVACRTYAGHSASGRVWGRDGEVGGKKGTGGAAQAEGVAGRATPGPCRGWQTRAEGPGDRWAPIARRPASGPAPCPPCASPPLVSTPMALPAPDIRSFSRSTVAMVAPKRAARSPPARRAVAGPAPAPPRPRPRVRSRLPTPVGRPQVWGAAEEESSALVPEGSAPVPRAPECPRVHRAPEPPTAQGQHPSGGNLRPWLAVAGSFKFLNLSGNHRHLRVRCIIAQAP